MTDDPREHFRQRATLWRWVAANGVGWYFLRLTGEVAEAISALALMRRLESGRRRGWGSLKIEARIGATLWQTSIFPGNEGSWLLPVKRAVRAAEGLVEGARTEVEVWL